MLLIALLALLLTACTPAPTLAPTLPSGPLGNLPPALAGLPRAEVNQGETVIRESRRFYSTDTATGLAGMR